MDCRGLGYVFWMVWELFVDVEEIIIFFGDVIIDVNIYDIVNNILFCLVVRKVIDLRQFGIVELK